jgi:DNA topoisomerase-2
MIIKKITKKANKIPKKYYDIEVEDYHNFFITKSKVVAHNSSLESTIIGMAQNFVGSNNINLLEPNGEYGTRLKGGKDASASRYIFTKLSPITREIFKKDDDEILDYLNDDGYKVEPNYYIPIIPMVLINGSDGIGTGWSSYVPRFNPTNVINYIEFKLNKRKTNVKLHPWYNGFKGQIIEDKANNRYISRGIYELSPNTINITELPVMTWNNKYYEYLDKLIEEKFIRDYEKHCTDNDVNITISLSPEIYETLTDELILKKFNLESYINMNNMNLFDENGKIYSYKDQYEIIDKFIDIRLNYYKTRKKYILDKFIEQKRFIINKMNFINHVLKKEIVFDNKTKDDIINQIEKYKIETYNESYDYLLNIPLISFSKEKIEELKQQIEKIKSEIELINSTSEIDMWYEELEKLKKVV